MNKNLLVGAIVAVLLAGGVVAGLVLPASDAVSVAGPQGERGAQGPKGDQGPRGLQGIAGKDGKDASPVLGGLSADNFVPHFSVNGVTRIFASQKVRQATSTACAFISPTASSSLLSHSINFTEGTTTSFGVDFFRTANSDTYATASQVQIGNAYDFATFANEIHLGILGVNASSSVTGDAGLDLSTFFKPKQMLVDTLYADPDDLDVAPDSDKSFNMDGDCTTVWQLF